MSDDYPVLRFADDRDVTHVLSRLNGFSVTLTCKDDAVIRGFVDSCRDIPYGGLERVPVLIVELDDGTVWQRPVTDLATIQID